MVLMTCVVFSCTVPKKFQPGKPFVFKNTITVNGNIKSEEKKELENRLEGQLDDSIRVRMKSYAGIYRELLRPPVFDSANLARSVTYMKALMEAQGYFRSQIRDSIALDTISPKEIRTNTFFMVEAGPVLRIDTVGYALDDSLLQAIALRSSERSLLKKGDPFRHSTISSELERLSDDFRNAGYLRFSSDNLYAEADTVDLSLINIGFDPFEQLELLRQASERRKYPTVKIIIRQRPQTDSLKTLRYYIGNVNIYPDQDYNDTSTNKSYQTREYNRFNIFYKKDSFNPKLLTRQSWLEKDSLYRQRNYTRTLSAYNQLGAWQQVSIDVARVRLDTVPIVDFDIRLVPYKKQSLIFELEGSRNSGSDAFSSGNLLGLGVNLGLLNKNVFREAIQSSTQLRAGIELSPSKNTDLIITRQINFGHSYSIPRLLIPFRARDRRFRTARTLINANAGYTERKDYFSLGTANASLGYEWSRRNNVYLVRPLNIELNNLTRKPNLDSLFQVNPLLRYNFSDGLIIGSAFNFSNSKRVGNTLRLIRAAIEESGGLTGTIFRNAFLADLYRFVKVEGEYKYYIEQPKSTWAFRMSGGYGYAYGRNPDKNVTLPFFRQFFAGGPNSMRAWTMRNLGPGSLGPNDSIANLDVADKLGDIQLEGNIEYRFNLGAIGGMKIRSALFADIGNIWYRSNLNTTFPIDLTFSRLYKDLAVAAGAGLRLDFDYFLLRFDWAFKIKNPYYSETNNGWLQRLTLGSGQLQLGIGYPF